MDNKELKQQIKENSKEYIFLFCDSIIEYMQSIKQETNKEFACSGYLGEKMSKAEKCLKKLDINIKKYMECE